jgi:hypothetical protein
MFAGPSALTSKQVSKVYIIIAIDVHSAGECECPFTTTLHMRVGVTDERWRHGCHPYRRTSTWR